MMVCHRERRILISSGKHDLLIVRTGINESKFQIDVPKKWLTAIRYHDLRYLPTRGCR
jgi:hypothetical protein